MKTAIDFSEFESIKRMGRLERCNYLKSHFEIQKIDIEQDSLLKLLNYDKISFAVIEIIFNKYFTLKQ
jgi:hypothetical protein